MAQFGRPSSDVTSGGWQPTPTSPAALYPHVNGVEPNDASFITCPAGGGTVELGLNPVGVPLVGPQIVRVRLRQTESSATAFVSLLQGSTVIATKFVSSVGSTFSDELFPLTAAQAAAITNYADLRVRVTQKPSAVAAPTCADIDPATLPASLVVSISRFPSCQSCQSPQDLAANRSGSPGTYAWSNSGTTFTCGSISSLIFVSLKQCVSGTGTPWSVDVGSSTRTPYIIGWSASPFSISCVLPGDSGNMLQCDPEDYYLATFTVP